MASIFENLISQLRAAQKNTPARSVMPVPVVHPTKGLPKRHVGFMAFNDANGFPTSHTALEHKRGVMTKK